jgi:hypothetical protein
MLWGDKERRGGKDFYDLWAGRQASVAEVKAASGATRGREASKRKKLEGVIDSMG